MFSFLLLGWIDSSSLFTRQRIHSYSYILLNRLTVRQCQAARSPRPETLGTSVMCPISLSVSLSLRSFFSSLPPPPALPTPSFTQRCIAPCRCWQSAVLGGGMDNWEINHCDEKHYFILWDKCKQSHLWFPATINLPALIAGRFITGFCIHYPRQTVSEQADVTRIWKTSQLLV